MNQHWQQQMRRQQEQMHRQQREQMRRQQEQMRRQQEQMRRQQQQMGAYYQQQQQAAQQKSGSRAPSGDAFAQVEAAAALLRRESAAGHLTTEQFQQQMGELIVQDASGNWWTVGAGSGEWYRHNGTGWVRALPPGRSSPVALSSLSECGAAPRNRRSHPFKGILVLLSGLALTCVIAGHLVSGDVGLGIWFVGVVLSIALGRKAWQGK